MYNFLQAWKDGHLISKRNWFYLFTSVKEKAAAEVVHFLRLRLQLLNLTLQKQSNKT